MKRHFHEELGALKQKLLGMGMLVEESIQKAVQALLVPDPALSKDVFRNEKKINQLEIDIDSEGHRLLAVGQPMAVDLRSITMILKINTDLERMGDHAVNIAERVPKIVKDLSLEARLYLPEMANAAQRMLRDALESFVKEDGELARSVLKRDDEVDGFNDRLYAQWSDRMEQNSRLVKIGLNLIVIGHNLERIADLAGNIAEDVIYMKQGKEVRHHVEEAING